MSVKVVLSVLKLYIPYQVNSAHYDWEYLVIFTLYSYVCIHMFDGFHDFVVHLKHTLYFTFMYVNMSL